MAIPVQALLIGVDVSKATLAICLGPDQPVQTLDNDRNSIARWLATLPAGLVCIAAEATNTFHLDLVNLAHHAGHAVYLVDGYRLSRYRDSIGTRAKTDASDAQLVQRYLAHERDSLRPWSPPPEGYRTLQQLLQRRATLVQARVALQQSLADLPGLKQAAATLFRQLKRIDLLIQKAWSTPSPSLTGTPTSSAARPSRGRSVDVRRAHHELPPRRLPQQRRLRRLPRPRCTGARLGPATRTTATDQEGQSRAQAAALSGRHAGRPLTQLEGVSIKDISTAASPKFRPW
jgi:hypothetical protein